VPKSDVQPPVGGLRGEESPWPVALPMTGLVAPPPVMAKGPEAPRSAQPAAKPAGVPQRPHNDDDLPPLADAHDLLGEAPAWLFSAIVHMVAVIVLGLLLVANERRNEFVLSLSATDDNGEDLLAGDDDVPFDLEEPPLEPGDALESSPLASLDPSDAFDSAPPQPVAPIGMTVDPDAQPIRLSLTGRQAGMKEALLRAYGGTSATERAVTEALRWLARNQQSSGLWSLSGRYANGASPDNPDAATAMALLAFQGAGYTPNGDSKEPFATVVTRGWRALLKRQQEDGNFFQEGGSHGRLYTQALCTIALCELYGMTGDSLYRDPAQLAVNYCVATQSESGGWRYVPGSDSDTSVTGWFVMALQSARMAGLEVPTITLKRVGKFLDTVSLDGGAKYSYTPGQGHRPSMTAEGLLCRQYLGWAQNDPRLRRGVGELLHNLPVDERGERDAYYWYYAAQVCHHMEGEAWRSWNAAMREVLPAMQVREGKERGSWDPREDSGVGVSGGGRLFVTCLSTYMLEVYYRHLPLYQLDLLQAKSGE
jgi:hypothetical protein